MCSWGIQYVYGASNVFMGRLMCSWGIQCVFMGHPMCSWGVQRVHGASNGQSKVCSCSTANREESAKGNKGG